MSHGLWRFLAASWSMPGLLTFCLVFLSAAGCFSRSRNPIRSVNSSGVNVPTRFLTG